MNIYCIVLKIVLCILFIVSFANVFVFNMCSNHSSVWFSTVLLAKVGAFFPLQEKSIFVEGFVPTWIEEQVKERFGKFGEIERVFLASNMKSSERKEFGFVNYTTQESALACIEAFSKDDELIDGDIKVWFSYCLFSEVVPLYFGRINY